MRIFTKKFITFFGVITQGVFCFAQSFEWAKKATVVSRNNPHSRGNDIAVDLSGNSVTVGDFMDTLVQDNDTLMCNGLNIGPEAGFISKRNSSGNLLWTKMIKSNVNGASCTSVSIDGSGNIYVGGVGGNNLQIDSFTITGTPYEGSFIIKINPSGVVQWTQRVTGFIIYDLHLDLNGNIYSTGYFYNSITFGQTTLVSFGQSDIVIAKCDNSGNWLWAKKQGGTGYDGGYSVGLDSYNNIYLTGVFEGNATFGTHNITCNGSRGFFLAKYDTSGYNLWVNQIITGSTSNSQNMVTDNNGNCYLSGMFNDTITFSTGSLISNGANSDIYVMKFDSSANCLWARKAGGVYQDFTGNICLDLMGNVYVSGTVRQNASFDTINIAATFYDAFIAKYSNSGAIQYVVDIGGANGYADWANGISVDNSNNIFITGEFGATIHFGSIILTTNNWSDYYVAKYNQQSGTLPVELTSFSGAIKDANIELSWTTASEINNDYFIIERSSDRILFSEIGKVKGEGNTTTEHFYNWVDFKPSEGISYYRLRQIDYDGKQTLSQVVSVTFSRHSKPYCLLIDGKLNFLNLSDVSNVRIISADGRLIKEFKIVRESEAIKEKIAVGIYFVHFLLKSGEGISQKIYFD